MRYEAANGEAEVVQEQTSCTAPMQTGCECICDLHGMHNVEDDLRGALLMADQFKDAAAAVMEDEADDEEVVRLQEKANTLRKFLTLMEDGLKGAAKEVPTLSAAVSNHDFNYHYNDVADFLVYIGGPDGRATESHAMQSSIVALSRATLLISKPAVLQSGGEGRALNDAIIEATSKGISDMYTKITDACANAAAEDVKPAPDVTDAEWDTFKGIVDGINISVFSQNLMGETWHKWLKKVFELRSTKVRLLYLLLYRLHYWLLYRLHYRLHCWLHYRLHY